MRNFAYFYMTNFVKASPAVLFVCLGNICRSPLAEAAFRSALKSSALDVDVDSAGTGNWHVGKPPDKRAQAVARKNGVDIRHYRARQVSPRDFYDYSHIIALDPSNLRDLESLCPNNSPANLALLLDYVSGRHGEAVADPYYGDDAGFELTWQQVTVGAQALVKALESE